MKWSTKRSVDLIAGWVIATIGLMFMAVILKPLAIPMFIAWFFVTLSVTVDLVRVTGRRRRALRELKKAMADPRAHRVVVLPSSPPQVAQIEPSGMILLPPQDRDARWGDARERARLQQSGQLHVDRDLQPLTDCPAGHYDHHELRGSTLDRVVRRCRWCSPSVGTWTEGPAGNEDSER